MGADNVTQFAVEVVDQTGGLRLAASGELDIATAPILTRAIDAALEGGGDVVLDLDGVEFIDSTGLRAIVNGRRAATELGRGLTIGSKSPAVERLLHVTGLDGEF